MFEHYQTQKKNKYLYNVYKVRGHTRLEIGNRIDCLRTEQ